MRTAVYLKNRSPTKAVDSTLYQAWTGQKPKLGHLQPFGCDIHSYIHPNLCTRWKPKTKGNTFVGYIDYTTTQYRVWNGHRIVVVAASHSRFKEQSYRYRDFKLAPNPLKWVAIGEPVLRTKFL